MDVSSIISGLGTIAQRADTADLREIENLFSMSHRNHQFNGLLTSAQSESAAVIPRDHPDVECIDLSQCTKHRTDLVASQKLERHRQESWTASVVSSTLQSPAEDHRACQPKSNPTAQAPIDDDENSEQDPNKQSAQPIVVELDDSANSDQYRSLDISFGEGSEGLRVLPDYLYAQLKTACEQHQTEYPDCIRAQTHPSQGISLFKSSTGGHAWFEAPDSSDSLLVARFWYGPDGQFFVVKAKSEGVTSFNNGRAAIVVFWKGSGSYKTKNGTKINRSTWKVWNPRSDTDEVLWIYHAMEWKGVTNGSQSKERCVAVNENKLVLQTKPRARKLIQKLLHSPFSVVNNKPSSGKRRRSTPANIDTRITNKGHTPGLIIFDNNIRDETFDTATSGARRDEMTGEILVKRKSDGHLVMLRCPECGDNKVDTQLALKCHMANAHGIRLDGLEAVVDFCGIAVQAEVAETLKQITEPSTRLITPQTPTAQMVSSLLPTPPNSATLTRVYLNSDAQFCFMTSTDDQSPRIRSIRTIDSAEKLFANAVAAGVARKDTIVMTVQIGADAPIQIVRGDQADFKIVMNAINNAKTRCPMVYVMANDLNI